MEWIRGHRVDYSELDEIGLKWTVNEYYKLVPYNTPGVVLLCEDGRFYFITVHNYGMEQRAEYRHWCVTHYERVGRSMMIGKGFHTEKPIRCLLWNVKNQEDVAHMEQMIASHPFSRPFYPASNRFRDPILIDGRTCFYLYDYYPVSRYDQSTLEEEDRKTANFIFRFKEGEKQAVELAARLVMMALLRYERLHKYVADSTLMVIPAATKERNEARYRWFCFFLAERQEVHIKNGIDRLTIAYDREQQKGSRGGSRIDNLVFSDSVAGRDILLFDDILNTGEGFTQVSRELIKHRANSVTGIFLAKTADGATFELAPPIKPYLKLLPPKRSGE